MFSNIYITLILLLSFLSNLSAARKTIPDVLYSDARFSKLVRALQRTRLLREINHFDTATLFAPINEAFDDEILVTRERMLYHFLPREVKAEELRVGELLTTKMELEERLGPNNIGQKVKVESEPGKNNSDIIYVGGGKIIDTNLQADNGIIHVITEAFVPPVDIYTTLSSFDQLQVFSEYLRIRKLDNELTFGNHITIFAPTDDTIRSQLKFHEREYLMGECGGGLKDLDIWTKHHLHYDEVLYSQDFKHGDTNVTTVQGEPIKVEKDDRGNMLVAGGKVTFKDLLAENGVIHIITSAATPHALRFNTHKYLCGLKCTKFVASTIKYGLQHYIESSDNPYTILAPSDEYFDQGSGYDALKYHIIEGKYLPSNLTDGMNIKTELKTEELRNRRQRATVTLVPKLDIDDNGETRRIEIQFNGAVVVGEPVEIGNDIIYILSETLKPPKPIIRILDDDKQLKQFNFYIMISDMIPTVRSAKGITVFAPSSEAIKQLGLINAYFVHQDAKKDLESLVSYHIINETIYSEDISESGSIYYTIYGEPIKVSKINNNILINDTLKVGRKDVLTSSGVLHVLDEVIMPPTLRITMGKLFKGINAQTFLEIVEVANLTELVNDPAEAFTILVPTEGAFKKVNVTKLKADPDLAGRWVRLHVIPSNEPLKVGSELQTLLSKDVTLIVKKHSFMGNYYYTVEVKGFWGTFEQARLLSSGKTWNGGVVYEIDKVLLPEHDSEDISRIFSEVVIGFVLVGFVVMTLGYMWHIWEVMKRRQDYEEIRDEETRA